MCHVCCRCLHNISYQFEMAKGVYLIYFFFILKTLQILNFFFVLFARMKKTGPKILLKRVRIVVSKM